MPRLDEIANFGDGRDGTLSAMINPRIWTVTATFIGLFGCQGPVVNRAELATVEPTTMRDPPEFETVEQAVAYVLDENSLFDRRVVVGSSEFTVTLPSGRLISSWYVESMFGPVFGPLGKKAIPSLIDMLDHEYSYARYGAYYALMLVAGRYDERLKPSAPAEGRASAIQDWRDWWVQNENSPRLDAPLKRVYEAQDWEAERIRP